MSRDAVAAIVAYNLPLRERVVLRADGQGDVTVEALKRKLEALAQSPFRFFRGTFHLMAADVLQAGKAEAPEGLIVGDLHLENFGVYRGQNGALVFDVNDFDDVGIGPIDLDVKRLCTSAMLLPGLAPSVRLNAARAIARGWADEVDKLGGRFPVLPWTEDKAEGLVQKLLREKAHKQKARSDLADPAKFVHLAKEWRGVAEDALREYVENLKQLKAPNAPKGGEIRDVAYRFKGTGSLGRVRLSVLLADGRLFEFKEARPSAMTPAQTHERARVQTASIRRLQGDPWPRVAATKLGKLLALGRENEPEEEKISSERFQTGDAQHLELLAYARQCGQVTARLHARANAPAMLASGFTAQGAARAAVDFAEKYAAQVEADYKAFVKARDDVAHKLLEEGHA